MVRRGMLAAGLLLAPVIAGCSSDDSSTTTAAGSTYNKSDVAFVQGMIPHHEQAIEMAEIALDQSSAASPKTRELAERIRKGQDPEVQQMRALLRTWGEQELDQTAPVDDGHDHSHGPAFDPADHGMLESNELAALDALSGPALDQRFAALMIKHHEGAITKSEAVKKSGASPEVEKLADGIIAAQKAEIAELRPLAV